MSNKIDAVIYPRGFAGFDIGLPTRVLRPSPEQLFNSLMRNKDTSRSSKVVMSNTVVEKQWLEHTTAMRFSKSFNFREEILISALTAFGTEDFLAWINLQSENPYSTQNHYRFINDTLQFIKTGKRALNIQHWLILLNGVDPKADNKVSIRSDEYFGTTLPLHQRQPTRLKHHIVKWVSNPGGFEDLLGTMHVLFGDADIL